MTSRNRITLIDTSSWIEALRADGNPHVRERVRQLILAGEAVWCDMIRIELWNGARGEYEMKRLVELEGEILALPMVDRVWSLACDLARKCRKAGKTVPPTDLLIASCALYHGAGIEHKDPHFDVILKIHS